MRTIKEGRENAMKIGILTFHKARNYGAFMQCYSLSKTLMEVFPEHEIEVIDYASCNLIHDYEKNIWERIFGSKMDASKPSCMLVIKRIGKTLLNIKGLKEEANIRKQKKQNFDDVQKYLPLTNESLITDNKENFKAFVEKLKYDVVVVGSDAIWNDNQTTWPNLYLLHDIKGVIKMSYAASTYGMDFSQMSEKHKDYVKEALEDFRFVGVRDNVSSEYVDICTNHKTNAIHTCDPSVFLDLNNLPVNLEQVKTKLANRGIDFNKPIIGLMCEEWLAKKVRKNIGEDYQYISVYYKTGYEDVFLDDLNPFEWALVFALFEATFTHFFHGTMFSIKNGTLTFAIERGSAYKRKYETKIKDVLTRLNLIDECYYEDDLMKVEHWNNIRKRLFTNDKDHTKSKYLSQLKLESKSKDIFIQELEGIINEE